MNKSIRRSGISYFELSDFGYRWILLATVGVLMVGGLRFLDIDFQNPLALSETKLIVFFGFASALFVMVTRFAPGLTRFTQTPIDFWLSFIQFACFTTAFLPGTYLAAAAGSHFPLLDKHLELIDAIMFGANWEMISQWIKERPTLEIILSRAYFSLPIQIIVLLLIGSHKHPGERNSEFMWTYMVSAIITTIIFVFTPAIGKIGHVGLNYVEIITSLRSGTLKNFSYVGGEGIVTFPSFHTTFAILFVYASYRASKLSLIFFAPLNIVMLVSIPPIGGHYITDLFGGAAVAILSIAFVRSMLGKRVTMAPFGVPARSADVAA
jgi:hypothetical protein